MSDIETNPVWTGELYVPDWSGAGESETDPIYAKAESPEKLYGVKLAIYERCSDDVRGVLETARREIKRSGCAQLNGLSLLRGLAQIGVPREFWEDYDASNVINLEYYEGHATNNVFNESATKIMDQADNTTPYKPIGVAKLLQQLRRVDIWSETDQALLPALFTADPAKLDIKIKKLVREELRAK